MSKNGFGRWSKVDRLNLNQTVSMVLTGHNVTSVLASKEVFKHIGAGEDERSVLDFGSGVGRNAYELATYSDNWNITCYDNNQMHEKAREFAKAKYNKDSSEFKNINFVTDWEEIRNGKYDCIIAVLVFQHIKEKDLTLYLKDIKNITKRLVVGGRRTLDERYWTGRRKNLWKILEKNGYRPSFCSDEKSYDKTNPNDHFTCVYEW
jgi:SAM-dependent methyltransferase